MVYGEGFYVQKFFFFTFPTQRKMQKSFTYNILKIREFLQMVKEVKEKT